jgi:ribokinase
LPKPGETVEGDNYVESCGGKGANQAVAAARLGAKVALVARVGNDQRGETLLSQLNRENVDLRFVVRDVSAQSGLAVIQVDEKGEKQIMSVLGSNRLMPIADIQLAETALSNTSVVLAQFEAPIDTVMEAIRIGSEAGALIVLDPAPPISAVPAELFPFVDLIKPNAAEALSLTGISVKDHASARTAAQWLLKRGVKAVAIEAGGEGNLLIWPGGEQLLPKYPVKSIDATGAGDAFAAAMAVALAEGRSVEVAAHFASAAAALATTKIGAQAGLPRRDAILKLIDHYDPEQLVRWNAASA